MKRDNLASAIFVPLQRVCRVAGAPLVCGFSPHVKTGPS